MKKKRIFSLLMTIVMAMMLCMTAFAQSSVIGPNAITIDPDGDDYDYAFGITKYMVVDAVANIPNETFTFQIVAADDVVGIGADTTGVNTILSKGPITKGPLPTDSTVSIEFKTSDDTTTGSAASDAAGITTTGSSQKYATKHANFDFSTVTYTKPGIYRYTISEVIPGSPTPGITYDDETYTLDVIVGYNPTDNGKLVEGAIDTTSGPNGIPDAEETGTMSILNHFYYLNGTDGTPQGAKIDDDSVSFPNTMASETLTVSKKVTGTLGDKEKYFMFSVEVAGTAGYEYPVVFYNADGTEATYPADFNGDGVIDNDETNPTSISIPTGETKKKEDFYLKDGQYLVVKGLPLDTAYTVSEDDYSTDGYVTVLYKNGSDTPESLREVTDTIKKIDQNTLENSVAFTNTKNATPLTGVIMQVLPFVLIVLLASGGFVLMMVSKRRKSQR